MQPRLLRRFGILEISAVDAEGKLANQDYETIWPFHDPVTRRFKRAFTDADYKANSTHAMRMARTGRVLWRSPHDMERTLAYLQARLPFTAVPVYEEDNPSISMSGWCNTREYGPSSYITLEEGVYQVQDYQKNEYCLWASARHMHFCGLAIHEEKNGAIWVPNILYSNLKGFILFSEMLMAVDKPYMQIIRALLGLLQQPNNNTAMGRMARHPL
jgi:hypothetical protein